MDKMNKHGYTQIDAIFTLGRWGVWAIVIFCLYHFIVKFW